MLERLVWVLLWLFVFTIPWEKSVMVQDVGSFARLLGIMAFGAGAVAAARRQARRPAPLALYIAGAFAVWSGLTFFWTLDEYATLVRAKTLAELVAMFWLIWEFCRSAARQRQLMAAYVAGAVVGSAIAFVRYSQHLQTYYRRYAAVGFDPNDFGLILALSIPMALYLALEAGSWLSWWYRAAALVTIVAIFLTGSRSATIATYVGFLFAAWSWREAKLAQRISYVVLFAVLLSGAFKFAPAAQRNRIATIPAEIARGTLHNRTLIWKSGLKAFKSHPIAGVGAGAYPEAVRPWIGRPALAGAQYVAHNTFLSVLVEGGLIGFAIYGLLLATLMVWVWTMPSMERAVWAVMLAVWATGVSTLTWEHYKPSWLIMALIATQWARAYWPSGKNV